MSKNVFAKSLCRIGAFLCCFGVEMAVKKLYNKINLVKVLFLIYKLV